MNVDPVLRRHDENMLFVKASTLTGMVCQVLECCIGAARRMIWIKGDLHRPWSVGLAQPVSLADTLQRADKALAKRRALLL